MLFHLWNKPTKLLFLLWNISIVEHDGLLGKDWDLNNQVDPSFKGKKSDDTFIHLIFGLQAYLDGGLPKWPNSLRRALNSLSLAMPKSFPKTLYGFLELCRQPTANWYPYYCGNFNVSMPILYDNSLSEEAQEFYFNTIEQMGYPAALKGELTQTTLDNLKMVELRERLRNNPDLEAAQDLYVQVRSFLIEESWRSLNDFRMMPLLVRQEVNVFYDEVPEQQLKELMVCERCGLLEWRPTGWLGIKPSYCSDHGNGAPHVHIIQSQQQLYRLKQGIHLRTFIPGRIELALFTFADELQAEYPNHLHLVERYPGLDTYDLRLTFADCEIWAVDAKDQAQPERLAANIRLPYGEGNLVYTQAFYVLPDARLNEPDYRDALEHAVGTHPANLHIVSLTEFQTQVETKVKSLARPSGRKKGKRI